MLLTLTPAIQQENRVTNVAWKIKLYYMYKQQLKVLTWIKAWHYLKHAEWKWCRDIKCSITQTLSDHRCG